METPDPTVRYRALATEYSQRAALSHEQWDRLANLRLLAALVTLAGGITLIFWSAQWLLGMSLMVIGLVSFVGLVSWHYRVGLQRDREQALATIGQSGLARLARDWMKLPLHQPAHRRPPPTLARDLDLLGHASLQHILNTPATPIGLQTLEARLLDPLRDPAQIAATQAAVRELAQHNAWRDQLELEGRLGQLDEASYQRLASWASDPAPNRMWPWLPPIALFLAAFTVGGFWLQAFGVVTWPLGWLGVAINTVITLFTGLRAEGLLIRAEIGRLAIERYAALLRHSQSHPFQSPALQALQQRMRSQAGRTADAELQRLARLLALSELRRNPFYLALQLGLLWNIHLAARLEAWRIQTGTHVPEWLTALGELEALNALATLAHDQPTWNWPTISAELPTQLAATALGHPLLSDERRVGNDLVIGPPGSLLLVTGSNMAGKSTLLRAIGLNMHLALMGGPVCAATFSAPPLHLSAVIRVEDSLSGGVSYFMAELERLRAVVEAARQAQQQGQPLLYLLDEILHGTNSVERQIAARRVLRSLVELGAIGAVSTHDLALAEGEELRDLVIPVHLREQIDPQSGEMSFDYQVRPGIAPSSNALRLLALVGLDQPAGD